ncbi:hypothetical protein N7493_009440 [Penicillium malachiteum]|uniref:Uncharacterized protein n=1 Tax=Penicillium malachiteum TaxID=1324776 RepID=A0AAD6HE51_9EURO|nr:hypothetical protein N7493_009440 [Penicillium malachiteum]
MNSQRVATLAETVLSAANYSILKNAFTSSNYDAKTSGTVIGGYRYYTLNYDWAAWSVASDSAFTSE